MPIPILLGLGALAAGAYGVKKGFDAKEDNDSARRKFEKAQDIYEEAELRLEEARVQTADDLDDLGPIKLQVWDQQFGRFVQLVEKVKKVKIEGQAAVEGLNGRIAPQELAEMREISGKAAEVMAGGTKALGAGALAGIASYGGATFLASASTGTAIASLSGVAATNATLAWLGGGSLAAGGLGVAGGTAVLGGIVAGPVLAVGGFIMAAKARENLAEAKKALAEAEYAVEQMESATSMMEAIGEAARTFEKAIYNMDARLGHVLDNLEDHLAEAEDAFNQRFSVKLKNIFLGLIGKKCKMSYDDLNDAEKRSLHMAYQFAQATKILLETPLLKKDGSFEPQSVKALEPARKLLAAAK